jgi:Uma2 family endonuclease
MSTQKASKGKAKKGRARAARLRLGPGSAGVIMMPEEFDAIPYEQCDPFYRYELIRGVLIVSPWPLVEERDPNEELGRLLRNYRSDHPNGRALNKTVNEQPILFGENRRRPDRVIWAGLGRVPDLERDVPTIIVEFVSAKKRDWVRDYEIKRDEYLALGVREYWVIDRFQRQMMVFKPGPDVLTSQVIGEKESYQTELLPGFVLQIAQLFAVADDWS